MATTTCYSIAGEEFSDNRWAHLNNESQHISTIKFTLFVHIIKSTSSAGFMKTPTKAKQLSNGKITITTQIINNSFEIYHMYQHVSYNAQCINSILFSQCCGMTTFFIFILLTSCHVLLSLPKNFKIPKNVDPLPRKTAKGNSICSVRGVEI